MQVQTAAEPFIQITERGTTGEGCWEREFVPGHGFVPAAAASR